MEYVFILLKVCMKKKLYGKTIQAVAFVLYSEILQIFQHVSGHISSCMLHHTGWP